MELILVRHGETLWNREGRVQGTSDIELSDAGRDQARRLALALKDRPLEAIYASPLKRALETASLINEYHGLAIETDRGLMEMDQGDFEGQTFKELMAKEKAFLKHWISDPASVTMPRGESFRDVQARSWPVMERIAARGQNVLVVSHNFTIAAILCRIRNISLSEFRSTCVDTASKTLIRVENGLFSVDFLNDRSHLEIPTP
jgi:broad specificity phosphatase PhoE